MTMRGMPDAAQCAAETRNTGAAFHSFAVKKAVEEGFVDRDELRDIGDRDALIGLVHRLADEAEFGDVAIGLDKARIGGAAGCAELGGAAGYGRDRLRQA